MTHQQRTLSWVVDIVLLTTVLSLLYFLWLGAYPLFTPDEGRYSEIAREMIATGDFITPHLNGVVFLDKPILYYWLQASAIKMFGLNEWALRFWPALIGVWGCLSLYISGRLLFNRRTGFISAVLLATSVLYYGAAHYANLDLEVAVLVSTALLFALLGMQSTNPLHSRIWIYAAYVFAGLAILTKGLIGIAFPVLIISAWILISGQWHVVKKLRPFSGLCIILAITLPWYIMAERANPEFFHFFFYVQQISRFLSTNDFNNRVAWWFYIPIVLAGFLPWSLLVLNALFKNIQQFIRHRRRYPAPLYLMLWAILVFIFFSVPHSKTIGYILPVFPPLALLTGEYLDQHWKTLRFSLFIVVITFFLFSIVCFAAPFIPALEVPSSLVPYLHYAGTLFFITTIVLAYFLLKKKYALLLSGMAISTVLFFFILINSAAVINQNSAKELALQLKTHLLPQDEVVTYYKYFQDLPLYLEKRITIIANWDSPDIPYNDNWLRELWYGKSFQDTSAWLINENTFWKRWNSAKRIYAVIHIKYFNEFRAKANNRLTVLDQKNEVLVVSNDDHSKLL